MAIFTAFVRHLLETGEARLGGPPVPGPGERGEVVGLLAEAFDDHALDVAGPPLRFAPEAAVAAAGFLAWSAWFLVHRGEPPVEVEARLDLPPPRCAADHLSADITLRFVATVHRRARAADPQDVLTRRVEAALRRWPLSGALADVTAPPEGPADLGGHPGLLLLFAERLAAHPRPAWLDGPVTPFAELVFGRRGVPLPGSVPAGGPA